MVNRSSHRANPWARVVAMSRVAGLAVACALVLGVPAAAAADRDGRVSVRELRVDTYTNPIGLDNTKPSLSWRLSQGGRPRIRFEWRRARRGWPAVTCGTRARSGQIRTPTWSTPGRRFDRGRPGLATCASGTREARRADWSAPARWEMGLLANSDWSAKWIENPDYTYATNDIPNPLPVFAKTFELSRQVAKARLYMTGLGQYAAKLNGEPVGEAVLEPGQTTYFAEVNYRTYDVTGCCGAGATCSASRPAAAPTSASARRGATSSSNNPARFLRHAEGDRAARDHVRRRIASRRSRRTRAGRRSSAGRPSPAGGPARSTTLAASRRTGPRSARSAAPAGATPRVADALVGHDARGYDAAGRRPAPAGDGRRRGEPGRDQEVTRPRSTRRSTAAAARAPRTSRSPRPRASILVTRSRWARRPAASPPWASQAR